MKKYALAVAILFVAGMALTLAGDTTTAGKTHDVTAEVVAIDLRANTITIKSENGDKTVPVRDKAVDELKTIKAGETVVLTCQDDAKGEHQAVVKIKKA